MQRAVLETATDFCNSQVCPEEGTIEVPVIDLMKGARKQTKRAEESGAILLLLVGGLLLVLIGFIALALGIAETRSTKSRLQEIADSAAQAGAKSYCSTVACFNDAREAAIRAVESELERSKLVASGFQLDRSDGPTWTIDSDLTITIERGFWWSDEVGNLDIPLTGLTLHDNNRFEPIDRDSGTSWQSENPMRPEHVIANAVYVRIERSHLLDTLTVYGSAKVNQQAGAYGIAGEVEGGSVCAAPFAVHICSLLNDSGDFDRELISQYERFFTGLRRYCADDDPHCNVLPGSFWSPVIDESRKNKRNGLSSDTWNPGSFCPPGVSSYIYRHACSYEPIISTRSTNDSLGDHFGVVGVPGSSGTATENAVMQTLLSPPDTTATTYTPGGCTLTKIGDRFDILEDGLTGTIDTSVLGVASSVTADDIVWAQINDATEDLYHHPEYDETFLLYGLPTHKAHQEEGWFYNHLSPNTRSRICDDYATNNPVEGACNSRVFTVHRECVEEPYVGMLGPFCSNLGPPFGSDFMKYDFITACPPLGTADPSFYYRRPSNPLGAYWDYKSYFDSDLAGPNPGVPRNTPKAWRIPIPILAPVAASSDTSTYSEYCQGVQAYTGDDPPFDPGLDYYVIGFVEALFYDTDVGKDSPDPIDLAGICPISVFDWYTEFAPWGFNEGEGDFSNRCNMVKGVIGRETALVTGKLDDNQSVGRNIVNVLAE